MPDALSAALATEGLIWLALASFAAGTVRGFAGFGSGLVLLPVSAVFLPPIAAITAMTIADFFGPLPILRRAVRTVHLPDLARLAGAMVLGLPIGVAILITLDPDLFRSAVSVLALVMLGLLISGLRYRGAMTPTLVLVTGGLCGVLGGVAGLPGPPLILLYLASRLPADVVRGTTMAFLFLYDIVLMGVYAENGTLYAEAVWIGLLLAVPNVLGNLAGAAIFRPDFDRAYRVVAYIIIATSAIVGLPIWN
ncbi:sulfite exporter TauE/SafE family protein [Sulfitobacter sp. D35]|uniref:sulfite exporter TauE/SafE family protein n=1 Tax=Sulfitobacter sp. D35 TaxID=3083252 RepID=UPI00296FD2AB|nr:sulfite exporter TauE/SafE family protein [Sulfitobacter sp. D35]MDW4496713.1 sulfite exporter TauE/SafE family protein [Sulfitobacter sp. D35]